ncbi:MULTISPECIES: LLM class flavin-dependent oxidoreductase [Chitinophagaceae]
MDNPFQYIRYSVLDLVTINKGDDIPISFRKSLQAAQEAEKCGYTRYWLSEHHNMPNIASSATSLLIGHIASGTRSIRVGSGGIMLPNHSTLAIAEQFGTLEALFPDRIDLGLGRAPGTDGRTATILRRGQPMMDYDFESSILQLYRYFDRGNATAAVRAIPGEGSELPIYILGSSTDSAFLAAKLGLPYAFAGHFAPAQFFQAAQIYQQRFQPSEHLDKPYLMACVNIIGAETDETAQHLSKSHIQAVLNILTDRRAPLVSPEDTELNIPSESVRQALHSWLALTFIGSKNSLQKSLTDFLEKSGANELIAYTNIYDQAAKLQSYRIFSELFQ